MDEPYFSHQPRSMCWPFVFAISALRIVHSVTAKDCLPNFPLKFQDQHAGDRKQVTLSGNKMTITPLGTRYRFLPAISIYFHSTMSAAALFLAIVIIIIIIIGGGFSFCSPITHADIQILLCNIKEQACVVVLVCACTHKCMQ